MTKTNNIRLLQLPFVSQVGSQVALWSAGLEDGRAMADALIDYMSENKTPFLLDKIAKAQVAAGAYGETEVIFWQRIAEYALHGPAGQLCWPAETSMRLTH